MNDTQQKQASRRKFLKNSAITAAAVAGFPSAAYAVNVNAVHVVPNNGSVGGKQAIDPNKYVGVFVQLEGPETAMNGVTYHVRLGWDGNYSEKSVTTSQGKRFSTTASFAPRNPSEPTDGYAKVMLAGVEVASKPLHFRKV